MASWIATWSRVSILSNSSMQQMPLSASISAPASIVGAPVSSSRATEAVRPAAVEALPLAYTARGRMEHTYFKNCDFAVEGSPTRQALMSPRSRVPSSGLDLCTPPIRRRRTPRLTSSCPKTVGAIERASMS
jgi:hypothetical protein